MARVLGITYNETAVRAVILKSSFKKLEVERYIEVILNDVVPEGPPPVLNDGTGPEPDPIGGVIARDDVHNPESPEDGPPAEPLTLEERRFQTALSLLAERVVPAPDRIVVALPGTAASMRVIEIPAGAAKRIKEVLPFELESVLPFDIEESVIDHQPLRQSAHELSVLACAVPKERIRSTLRPLHMARIYPRELAVGAAALDGLAHLVPDLAGVEPQLLLDVGQDTSEVCILSDGQPVFARTVSAGAASPESLRDELLRTLSGLRARAGLHAQTGFVFGQHGEDAAMLAWLSEVSGVELAPLPLPETADRVPTGPLGRFGLAASLAARPRSSGKRINMLQGEFAPKRAVGAVRRVLPALATAAAAIMFTLLLSVWSQYALLSDNKRVLTEQLASVTQSAFGAEVESAEEARELLGGAGRHNDPLPEFDAYDLIDALTQTIPEEVTHDTQRLTFNLEDDGHGARFEIKGTVPGIREIDGLIQRLKEYECGFCEGEKRRCLTEIDNRGATATKNGQNYQLEGAMRCPGRPAPEGRRRDRRSRR